MQLIQTVVVKQIVTEDSKQKLFDRYTNRKLLLLKECDQLQFELKRLERSKNFSKATLQKQFEKEIHQRHEKIRLIEFQMEQLHILPLGSEIKEGEVQALLEVNIGDSWDDRKEQPAIIVKDGIVKEIR